MFQSVLVQICSLVYLVLLIGTVFSKRKFNTLDEAMYKVLLFFAMFSLIFDIGTNILIFYEDKFPILLNIVSKLFIICNIWGAFYLFCYVLSINSERTLKEFVNSKMYIIGVIVTIIATLFTFAFSSIYFLDSDRLIVYQSGKAMYYGFLISSIYIGAMIVYLINNPKKISIKKIIPIIAFLLLMTLAITLQWIFKSILLVSSIYAFIMLLIYFTMDNPDKRIISELEKDKEQIEEESSAKTDFLSNMSHDIRTPMNAIIGFTESLLSEDLNDEQRDEVNSIYQAATTLLDIINNILDVSRIESGKEEKKEGNYNFKNLINKLTTMITSKLDSSRVKFNLNIDSSVPAVLYGDEIKLYQILMNLLSNAVKYTEKGQIDFNIKSENVGDMARITFVVSDTGLGIKESDYDKMFVKFSRLHNAENHKSIEGTGLGLVITKSLVELLGGTINFTSKYGEGTTFTAVIPQKIVSLTESKTMVEQNASEKAGSISASNLHFDGSLYDILIVDDNELNIKVAKRILSDYKFQIFSAQSGDECLELLKSGRKYDLILLDHMMPGKDGIQTLHEIKAIDNIKIPPIVALTANAMVGQKEKYLAEGFDDYLSKPISRDELQKILNNIFCKHE